MGRGVWAVSLRTLHYIGILLKKKNYFFKQTFE